MLSIHIYHVAASFVHLSSHCDHLNECIKLKLQCKPQMYEAVKCPGVDYWPTPGTDNTVAQELGGPIGID